MFQFAHYFSHQLLELLPTFPSAHLREHLHYVIQHVPALSQAQRSTPTQAPIKSRDVRAQLYARIGLKQTREISKWLSDLKNTASASSLYFTLLIYCGII